MGWPGVLAEQDADILIVTLDEERGWRFVWTLPSDFVKGLTICVKRIGLSQDQISADYNCGLASAEAAQDALQAVMNCRNGWVPDVTFLCAGGATPKFFVEMTKEDSARGWMCRIWDGHGRPWCVFPFSRIS